MQRGVSSELSKSFDGRQLRRSGDVLKPRRLSDRPGDLPGPLYVHGGVAPTMLSVLAFHPEGVQRYRDIKLQQLAELVASGCPQNLIIQTIPKTSPEPPGEGAVQQVSWSSCLGAVLEGSL